MIRQNESLVMAQDFATLWRTWTDLSGEETPSVEALRTLQTEIYNRLAVAPTQDERQELAQLLASVLNRIRSAGTHRADDLLTEALREF